MVVTLDDPFWQGAVIFRVFGWFSPGGGALSEGDHGILLPLEAFARSLPNARIELMDTQADPSLVHTHLVSCRRAVRVFGPDGKQVECPDLRSLWPPSASVFVEGRPTKWFGDKHGFRRKDLDRPIGEYEYTELAALRNARLTAQARAAPDLWMLPDPEDSGNEYGPVSRNTLILLCDWGLMELSDRVRCLGQPTLQRIVDQKGTPAPEGTILPSKEQAAATVVAYLRARARAWVQRHYAGRAMPSSPVPVPDCVDAPPHFRFAGCDWAEGAHPSLRLFYVSGGEFTAEVRLFPFSPALDSDDPRAEPPCLSAFREERIRFIKCGLFGRQKPHIPDLLAEVEAARLCDGRIVRLRRWRPRVFEETVVADDLADIFLPVRSGRLWALLRLSMQVWLWNDLAAERERRSVDEPPEGLLPSIRAWQEHWTDWLDLFARGSVQTLQARFVDPAARGSAWITDPSETERVLAPFEPCRAEVVWFAPDAERFTAEAHGVREAGVRVRFVASREALFAAIRAPELLTIVVPGEEKAAGAEGLLEALLADIADRRANHRIIQWYPGGAPLPRRRRDVSACRQADMAATLGTELHRPRYPVVDRS
ncbi:MAG: hypothetical protein JJT96_06025 [Opitutales bacterium]|nr:hypothetical protein [Opitutales bacterium]